jgi:hypothetical protein
MKRQHLRYGLGLGAIGLALLVGLPWNNKIVKAEGADTHAPPPPGRVRPADVPDPTRATSSFEKTFRELSKSFHPSGTDTRKVEKKRISIVLKATIIGSGKPGSILVLLGNELRWIPEGGEVSVNIDNENLSVRLDKLNSMGAHLRIMPWNEEMILR